ncbi:MAG: putative SnoaL-like aldol condensation-catalyzing enzyme [Myxococcota bacterium]|jgi:predicted SnoaL-like aldol condensation-catalyzing enzyme
MGTRLDNATRLYMEGIRDGDISAIDRYTGDRYTQHSTGVPDGQEGFKAFFRDFLERNPKRDIRIVRGWEDGEYVFVQAYQSLNDGEFEYVTTDFFHTDAQGRIIEHWDVISELGGPGAIDGATAITDLHATEANKRVVQDMLRGCLFPSARAERIADWVAEDIVQHNPDVPDGRAAFAAFAQDADRPLVYDDIVLCAGRGNFVATMSRARLSDQPLCWMDIFRLEDGRVVEHWDNSEPAGTSTVNGGKF